MDPRTEQHLTAKVTGDERQEVPDALAVEEALEIFVDGVPYAVTMRLPGEDLDLVTGFCLTEGVVLDPAELAGVERCREPGGEHRVLVTLAPAGQRRRSAVAARRQVHVSRSSCGICGKQLIEEVHSLLPPVPRRTRVDATALLACRTAFEGAQRLFRETGATHGAAVFDETCALLAFAEDIGRHNALDKVIGALVRSGRLERARLAVVSSRLSFEMVQKAAAVGLELLAGVSAATTLAVRLAERQEMTLVGFLRDDRMNVYTCPDRVRGASPPAAAAPADACGEPACPARGERA